MNEPLLLRVEEAAKLLQIGRNKVYELAAAGEIPSLHVGRQLRIPTEGLREWIRLQAVGAERVR
ncbi:MAG: helix-turn-helix domain-containing protein [Chloroflexota bacterium]|nr:helix-turn-helix domain-containing protein [Chloroflexota bacterium]MDE3095628.1 helix-turn-helix domain-containing protein [Chloroflexota bacterium]